MADREYNVYQAKLAEQAERYDEMVLAIRRVASLDVELSVEERNLLAVAYKNQVGMRRASWRAVFNIEQKEKRQGMDSTRLATLKEYRESIEKELQEICSDVLTVLDSHLLPHTTTQESHVFYHKMKGDYCRYLTEVAGGDARREAAEQSLKAYQMACSVAREQLPTTHPVRLGLALNFSVFYYEVLGSPERACTMAKTAFDAAAGELSQLEGESYKDTTLIMQLLRDNHKLWAADIKGEGAK